MNIIERARRYRHRIEQMVAELPDTDAIDVAEMFPHWKANTEYAVGDRVCYGILLYKCLIAHTSQSTWIPPDAPSLWAKVSSEEIPEWEQPSSTNPYMKGDKVRHNGTVWISTVDNNVWEPGVYGWDPVE